MPFALQSEQMSQSKDRFNKAIEIYKAKYKMELKSLLKFIRDKIDSPEDKIGLIEQRIQEEQEGRQSITEEELRNYLHIVAAVQGKVNIKGKELEQLKEHTRIKFKSKKTNTTNKEEVKKEENKSKKVEGQSEVKKEEKPKVIEKPIKMEKQGEKIDKQKKQSSSPTNQKKEKKQQGQQIHSSPFLKEKPEEKKSLNTIEQNISEQDRTSTLVPASNSEQFFAKFPEAQLMKLRTTSQKQVQIRGYDKFGQNYLNPIIKYRLIYKEQSVYRRYTQFQNLMRYLNKRYEGFILPELPPKEGIKSNLSYIWGVDEAFLNDRQLKLQEMLNMLMNSKFISQDQILVQFLTNQNYEVQCGESVNTLSYIRSLGEIAFNAKELKTYGMAYYNYFKSFKKTDISTKVTECYKQAEQVLSYCIQVDNYRTAIINNFDKRREIFSQLEVDQNDRTLTITQFDKLSSASACQVHNLQKEMNKYYELKSQQSWLGYLIGQKQQQIDNNAEQVRMQLKEITQRIGRMELNLMDSIDNLVRNKQIYLEQIGTLMLEWRKCIHP